MAMMTSHVCRLTAGVRAGITISFARSTDGCAPYITAARSRRRLAERHHLHRRVAHFLEEPVQRRPLEEDLPARAGALAEDHVGDPLALGERDQAIGRTLGLDPDDRGAQVLRQ